MPLNLMPPAKGGKKSKSHIGALALKKAKEPKKLIYISTFLISLVLILGFYVIVKNYRASLSNKITRLEEENKTTESQIRKFRQESAVGDFQSKLKVLDQLVKDHTYWQGVFDFFEEVTLRKVQIKNFNADFKTRKIRIDGITVDFTNLAGQMIAYQRHDLVEYLKLNTFNITDEGIKFSFDITLKEAAWKNSQVIYSSTDNYES